MWNEKRRSWEGRKLRSSMLKAIQVGGAKEPDELSV